MPFLAYPSAMPTSTAALEKPTTAGSVFDTVLDAYRADGFDAGYRRAVNDMLADFALVAAEFIRERGDHSVDLHQALRDFQLRFEMHLERAAAPVKPTDHFFDGGLGI